MDKRVAYSLWNLGIVNSEQFGVGCKTADEINFHFLYTIYTIFEQYHQVIHFPDSEQEIQTATYIKTKSPDDDADDYICRKGYHSTILQAVVGADTEIFDASTGYPGSIHDARVFRLGGFFNRASQGQIEASANGPMKDINGLDVAPFIVGDGAYPLQNCLLKPHPKIGVLAKDEKRFNKELSKACVKEVPLFAILTRSISRTFPLSSWRQ